MIKDLINKIESNKFSFLESKSSGDFAEWIMGDSNPIRIRPPADEVFAPRRPMTARYGLLDGNLHQNSRIIEQHIFDHPNDLIRLTMHINNPRYHYIKGFYNDDGTIDCFIEETVNRFRNELIQLMGHR